MDKDKIEKILSTSIRKMSDDEGNLYFLEEGNLPLKQSMIIIATAAMLS